MNKENQRIEYKSIWKDEYLKTICAFANSDGGILFVGKSDSGRIVGVENHQQLLENLPNKIVNLLGIYSKVNQKIIEGKVIIEIEIEEYQVPVSFKGKFYFKSGSTTQELNGSSLQNFLLKKSGKTWDEVIEDSVTIKDINLTTIEKFKGLSAKRIPSIINESDPMHILKSLNLVIGGKFKRAALILFGKNPQRLFINSYTKIGRFKTDSELLFDDIINGNLFDQIDGIFNILLTKYIDKKILYDGIVRNEIFIYPYNALREAVINALVHKDYSGVQIQISVYDEKMIIWNDGGLVAGIAIDDLKQKHISKARNFLIADIFYKAGFIEAWGRGTNNIVEEFRKNKLPEPFFEEKFNGFQVEFTRFITEEKLKKTGLNERQIKSYKYVIDNQKISNSEYQKINRCSRNTASNDLQKLFEKGIFLKSGTKGSSVFYSIAQVAH